MSSIISRLKAVPVRPSVWDRVPYTRRAGVLVVLFHNKFDEISPVLTLRSKDLSSFSGHAALPGGKADHDYENAYQVARRETMEEVGLSQNDEILKLQGINVDFLTSLPAYLSRNLLAVKPSIVVISGSGFHIDTKSGVPDFLQQQTPEVSEVFSVPLVKFLSAKKGWYTGRNVNWGGLKWNQHHFQSIRPVKALGETAYMNIWGLTANILVDVARLSFGREPSMSHRRLDQFGDEQIIEGLLEKGYFTEKIDRQHDLNINFSKIFGNDHELLDTRRAV